MCDQKLIHAIINYCFINAIAILVAFIVLIKLSYLFPKLRYDFINRVCQKDIQVGLIISTGCFSV